MAENKNDFPAGSEAALIVPVDELSKVKLAWWAGRGWEDIRRALKVVSRYQYDGGNLRVKDLFGHEYSLQIHKEEFWPGSVNDKKFRRRFGDEAIRSVYNNVYTLRLWDYVGTTALFGATFVATGSDAVPDDVVGEIRKVCERYLRGIISCSDCGADVDRRNPPGRYFAGKYCEPCWIGETGEHKGRKGWKAVEAKETYE